ncbi:MAG: DUF1328 domain-containing protein [Pseudobdellovibrionaceae bacterium]
MLQAALTFFVIALCAMLFGAYGIAGVSMEIARILLFVFLALAVVSLILGLVNRSGPRKL